jgi:deoxyhypusine synthase
MTEDTMELMQISQKTRNSAVISLGASGAHKMLDLAEVTSYITRTTPRGHKYAISITTDPTVLGVRTPAYSGGHTSSFGKLHKSATTAFVNCDPSIALPMIITALSQTAAKFMKGRKRPNFSFSGSSMSIDVP